MTSETINPPPLKTMRIEVDGEIGTLTLDRPDAFAQDRDLGEQIHARLVIRLLLPFLVDTLVAGAHAYDAILFVIEHLCAGKFRKDIYARRFAFFAQPGRQAI